MRTKQGDEYRLWQRSNGVWYIANGSGKRTKLISTGSKNRATAEILKAQFIAGLDNVPPPPSALVKVYFQRYKDEHGQKTKRPKNIDNDFRSLMPFFGNLQPEHIGNKTLQRYAEKRKADEVGNATILREIDTLRAALNYAASNRWIKPMPVLRSPVQKPPARDIWLTREQVNSLLRGTNAHHLRLFIMLAISTAARSGAILELTWDQVDLDSGLIDFGRGWGNKRRSVVPMNDDLRTELLFNKQVSISNHVVEWQGKKIASVKKSFRELCKRLEIKASPHVLRHTAATWMVIAGVPLAEVARLLGASERTVERVYGKHSPDYLRRAVTTLKVG